MDGVKSPPRHIRLDGTPTHAADPKRGVWYSAHCHYWTDDWNALTRVGPGIPACPVCKCVGLQTEAERWFRVKPDDKERCVKVMTSFLGGR